MRVAGPGQHRARLLVVPRHRLVRRGTSLSARIIISTPGRVIRCQKITGMVYVEAPGVTIENSTVTANSGRKGLAANGTAGIFVADGASATIDHVTINGHDGVHACIWHQGMAMTVNAVDCHGVNDGIFTWADTPVAGDHFTIENSYFHGFTHATANGHEDGFQTEGASYGLIRHNTYQMSTTANSAVAIWDSLERARRITVAHNLITGGGFAMYAEDYSPGDSRPGDPSAIGGFAVTGIWFSGNIFSVAAAGCVGKYGVWFTRPAWPPYDGGPTDGWHRHGNIVLETGEHIDAGNPHVHGQLCR